MKIKSVLSGVAAILLVSAFYIFAFGIVDQVDDTNISDDYLYSTETSYSESVSAAETSSEHSDEMQSFIDTEGNEYYFIPDTSLHNINTAAVNTSASEEQDAPEELVESYNDEELFDDNDSEGLNFVEASSQPVYARDKDSDVVLSRLSNSSSSKSKGKKTTTTTTATATTTTVTTTAATTTERPVTTTPYTQTTSYYTYDTTIMIQHLFIQQ